MFNPFGLNGPDFLIFYTLLGILVNLILRILSRKYRREVIDIDLWSSSDPYNIAYLRAGFQETLRVVVFSLMKRGLLHAAGDLVESRDSTKKEKLLPLEKAVLDYFATPHNVSEVYSDTALITLGDEYQKDLEEKNLLFNHALLKRRKRTVLFFIGILLGVSALKIGLAIQRGHSNIMFLVLLTLVFSIMAVLIWPRRRTPEGDVVLQTLQIRQKIMRKNDNRFIQNHYGNDAEYRAALFSISMLSAIEYPFIKQIFPKESKRYSGGVISAAGCGGGGCGGGGCGGGCGGCGG